MFGKINLGVRKIDNKKWYMRWWVWLIAIVVLVSVPVIINRCFLIGTENGQANTAYSASDILNFYGTLLSFLGTVFLGALALWQNTKLNQINTNLQKTQMREQIGVLFPKRETEECKDILCINLQNRGKDIIFNCLRMKSYINGKEIIEQI